jgi:hypothetical protein
VRLYLDEDLASRELIARLAAGSHDVLRTLRGESDADVWAYAQRERAAVVTRNGRDFEALAGATPGHYGLLLVYLDNDRRRDMTFTEIAAAIERVAALMASGIEGRILVLNAFRTP